MKEQFRKIANSVSNVAGSAWVFCLAFLTVVAWAVSGPMFNFSDTWQLVINTGTTIVTFLMVFLIQNTQNRDGKAMQLKLDELLRATKARETYIDIEALSDSELEVLAAEFSRMPQNKENTELFKKFQGRIQDVLTKRRMIPGEQVASQMASILNPFSQHNAAENKKSKKPSSTD